MRNRACTTDRPCAASLSRLLAGEPQPQVPTNDGRRFDGPSLKRGAVTVTGDEVVLELFDKSLTRRIVSSIGAEEPTVTFFDDLSRKRAELSVDSVRPQLIVFDDAEFSRQVIGLTRYGASLTLLDTPTPLPPETIGTLNSL